MYSIGIDMVEIARVKKSMQKPNFLKYILGEKEFEELKSRKFPPQSVSANFAAKEAFAKSIGLGFKGFKIKEVEVLRKSSGEPFFYFTGNAKKIVDENNYDFSLSLTHTSDLASAAVICFKKNQGEM